MIKWFLQGLLLIISSMIAVKISFWWDQYMDSPLPLGIFDVILYFLPYFGAIIDEKNGFSFFAYIFFYICGAINYMPIFITTFYTPRIALDDLDNEYAIPIFIVIDIILIAIDYFNILDSIEIFYGLSMPYNYPTFIKVYFWLSVAISLWWGYTYKKTPGKNRSLFPFWNKIRSWWLHRKYGGKLPC